MDGRCGPINIFCIRVSPRLVALPRGDGSAATPPGPMPPLYPEAPPQSSFSGLVGEKKKRVEKHNQLGFFVRACEDLKETLLSAKTWPGDVSESSALEMSDRGLAERVAL